MERVKSQLSHAIVTAIPTSHSHHLLLRGVLHELVKWDSRSNQLRERAYEWCSAICKTYPDLEDGKELLFLSLKIGFRGLDFRHPLADITLDHTEHHRRMVDVVFNSGDDEVIADLLQAWGSTGFVIPELLAACARCLIDLWHVPSASQRLRRLVIRSVKFIGFQEFERVGVKEFAELLGRLNIGANDVDHPFQWLEIFVSIVRFPQGRRSLPHSYCKLMVELTIAWPWLSSGLDDYERVMVSLEEEEEWDILEYWAGVVWILRRPKIGEVPEDVERVTLSLFRQRPDAIQKLEQWLRRSTADGSLECVECIQWICERGGLGMAPRQDTL